MCDRCDGSRDPSLDRDALKALVSNVTASSTTTAASLVEDLTAGLLQAAPAHASISRHVGECWTYAAEDFEERAVDTRLFNEFAQILARPLPGPPPAFHAAAFTLHVAAAWIESRSTWLDDPEYEIVQPADRAAAVNSACALHETAYALEISGIVSDPALADFVEACGYALAKAEPSRGRG